MERALIDIRETLRHLTPAEQLAGYDEAIRHLSAKIEQIVLSDRNPETIKQLEAAINALRGLTCRSVASGDALARLAADVAALSAKVDHLTTK